MRGTCASCGQVAEPFDCSCLAVKPPKVGDHIKLGDEINVVTDVKLEPGGGFTVTVAPTPKRRIEELEAQMKRVLEVIDRLDP